MTVRSLVVALAALAASAAETPSLKTFETVKLADGILAFIASEPQTSVVCGNSVAIAGDDGVLVVDSGNFPSGTRRMLAEIQKMTRQPVRFLVHTHWHPDHLLGDGVYREAFPQLVVIGHPVTRTMIPDQVPKYINYDGLRGYQSQVEEMLASGKHKDGSSLSDAERQDLQPLLRDLSAWTPEVKDAKYEAPALTFDRSLTIHLGKREVRLMHLGRGNTGGDVVAYVPDAKVLATGDLVVNPTPYGYGSYLTEWIQTLDKLMSFDAQAIVPGHGPVQHDYNYVRTIRDLLQSLTDQVQKLVAQGATLDDVRKKVDLEAFRAKLAGTNPVRNQAFQQHFVTPAVERAFYEAKFAQE